MSFFLRGKQRRKYFPEPALRKHAYCVAQSGSGKSEIQKPIIYDLIRRSRKNRRLSIGLIEPHGDLAQEVLSFHIRHPKHWNRLIYINPSIHKLLGCKEIYTPVINPFDIPARDEETIDAFAQEITNACKEMIKTSSSSAGISRNMDAIIKPCIATLLRKGDADLRDLKRFMGSNNADLVKLGQQSPDPEHREFFTHGFLNDQYAVTKNALYIKLQSLLNSPTFRRLVVGKSTVNLHKAFNSGKIVIFDVAKSRGRDTAADFGKLMLAYIQAIALRRQDTPKAFRKQIYLFVDEAANYVGKSVEEALCESRKFGLSLFLSSQIVGQGMNTELTNIIMSNATLKIVGKNETKSLRQMSSNIGIDMDHLQRIPRYQFYIHNKDWNRPAVLKKSRDFLVRQSGEPSWFYYSKEQVQELLRYLIRQSGMYQAIARREETAEIISKANEQIIDDDLVPY